jgi:hypothetical protein
MFKKLLSIKQSFMREWEKDYEKVPVIYECERSCIGHHRKYYITKYEWVKNSKNSYTFRLC